MTATNHTEHYELSQYTDNDHPTYTGDYNGDMAKIDSAIYAASQSGMTAVAHTNDLTGDGTKNTPLGIRSGTAINPTDNGWADINFNDFYTNGIYTFNGNATNAPRDRWITGALVVLRSYQLIMQLCFFHPDAGLGKNVAYRQSSYSSEGRPSDDSWEPWKFIV